MKDLIGIAELLSVQKLKQIDIVTEDDNPQSKSALLFTAIRDGLVKTDEEARNYLYGKEDKSEAAYLKLKYRLKEKMINTLFFVDIQQYSRSPADKAKARVSKNFAAAQLLLSRKKGELGRNLLESTLKSCVKFDLIDYQLMIYRELNMKYGLFVYDKRKYEMYKRLYKVARETYDLLHETELYFQQLGYMVTVFKGLVYDEKIKTIEKTFMPIYEQAILVDDYWLRFRAYNTYYFLLMFKNDLEEQSRVCDEALEYFSTKKGFSKLATNSFLQKKGLSMLALNQPEKASFVFKECIGNKPLGSFYVSLHSYLFTCYILLEDYDEAYKTLASVMNHKFFKNTNIKFKQTWYIKEALVYFLIRTHCIDPSKHSGKPLRKFRMGRFENDVSEFSKDKKGMNITINILKILFHYLNEDFDKANDKSAALKQYSFRHLKGKEFFRPRTFINMLENVHEARFKSKKLVTKSDKLLEVLKDNPLVYSEQSSQIEVMPFEKMWELLIRTLRLKISA